jgi:hypothetical protein
MVQAAEDESDTIRPLSGGWTSRGDGEFRYSDTCGRAPVVVADVFVQN